jgi:hypothetical protein
LARSRRTSPRTRESTGLDSARLTGRLHLPEGRSRPPFCVLHIDVRLQGAEAPLSRPHWLLALALPFSRNDRAHTKQAEVPELCRTPPVGGAPVPAEPTRGSASAGSQQ